MKSCYFVHPTSHHYLKNKLFDPNSPLNRDDCLRPFINLAQTCHERGDLIYTSDMFDPAIHAATPNILLSMSGVLPPHIRNAAWAKKILYVLEPPVVDPRTYRMLPQLAQWFDYVHVHNAEHDGFSLPQQVAPTTWRKLYWPMPYAQVHPHWWAHDQRDAAVVMINGLHNPRGRCRELYSARIHALLGIAPHYPAVLYGRGWGELRHPKAWTWAYLRNRAALMRHYAGACEDKYATMARYRFALCFENMYMAGYMTEKLFDCFYVGTVPIYWGATDIQQYVPENSYIDARSFGSWKALAEYLRLLPDHAWEQMRAAGRDYLNSAKFQRHTNSLVEAVFDIS